MPAPALDVAAPTQPLLPPLPVGEDPEAAAAAAAEVALQEAQASARRALAEREAAAREAAAREAAREQSQRLAAQEAQRAAELEARRTALQQAQLQAQLEQQRQARLQAEQERRELERRRSEQAEAERAAAERVAAERLAAERAAAERAAAERAAAERAAAERAAVERAAAAQVPPPAPPPTRRPDQALVMVADDSKVVRVKTSRLLAAHHFRVVLAEDGLQALALAEQETPQVLVTDVEMPGLDGLDLTRRLRADPRTAALPVIMITSADDRLAPSAAAAGVSVLMGKPYAAEDLVAHVARLAGVTLTV